ncbi:MAG: TonB-dependent receptor [Phenylobacterium sp.]|nr:TonB-dependent receptor [Phenylobacterium sp.]
MRGSRVRQVVLQGASALGLASAMASTPAFVIAAETAIAFDIRSGTLEAALVAYSAQSHRQLLYSAALVAGRQAPALKGRFTADEALERLLSGSGLVAGRTVDGSIILRARPATGPTGMSGPAADGVIRAAAQSVLEAPDGAPSSDRAMETAPAAPPTMIAEVVVTGTHLRGVGSGPSEVVTLDGEALTKRGYATIGEALASLPQNFGGVGTPTSLLAGADPLGTNTFAASGVNLRGLGSDATLVLVDGRRMAGTGSKGDFADVSAVPAVAVERVDVLLDGASALYGSDAVGGVVNIHLRKSLDGAETRARYGVGSGGAAEETQFAQALGKTWQGGRALLAYEYYHRADLLGADRDYAASTDLRAFGGTDHRAIYSSPGNVLRLDSATSTYVPIYAIRAGPTGAATGTGDFVAGEINLQNQRAGTDLLPDDRRDSVYGHFDQSLSARVTVDLDGRYTRRRFTFLSAPSTALISMRPANPNYVPLPGLTTQQIGYSFANDLGASISGGYAESLGLSAGLKVDLWGDWRAEAYGAFAQEVGARKYTNVVNTRFLSEALGNIADDPATSYSAVRDGYFNPYGAGKANSAAVLSFIGSGFSRQVSRNEVDTLSVQADGTLFSAPGGRVKLALGVQRRTETFDQKNLVFTSTVAPSATRKPGYDRAVSSAFVELRAPIVGPDNALPGIAALDLSVAGRVERYDDVGTTADPKLGVIWKPRSDLTVRVSYGTSFRAPTLSEVFEANDLGASLLQKGPSKLLSVIRYGGNQDLKPETATSWSAGVDFAPETLPGLRLSATWFDTRFRNRIARPALDHISTALSDPAFSPFVTFLDPSKPADLATINGLITDPTFAFPGLFPADAYGAVVDARYVNTASTRVEGIDLAATYGFDRGPDRFEASLSATYLARYDQQLTPNTPAVSLLDTPGEPVDWRARASFDWSRGPWSATVSANHVDSYGDGESISSWTTFDLQGRWRPAAASHANPLHDVTVVVSVLNLFDRDPPFYDSPQGVGFDAANASPMGRFASIQLTKAW